MQCPECKVDAYIMGSRTEVVGDQSPDTQTEVWQVMTFECRNDRCPMRGRQVGELRHRIHPPPEEIEEPSRGSKENTLA